MLTCMTEGEVATEYVMRIADGTKLCAVVSMESRVRLVLQEGDRAWTLFNCFAVVLHADVQEASCTNEEVGLTFCREEWI